MNWAYLVCCADGTFYAGWTHDLKKRLAAHNAGAGAKYTRGRRPVALAWAQNYATQGEAMRRELALKRMTRAQKLMLINESTLEVQARCTLYFEGGIDHCKPEA